ALPLGEPGAPRPLPGRNRDVSSGAPGLLRFALPDMTETLARGPLQDAMTDCLVRHDGRRAVVDGAEALSYRELGDRIQAAAHGLRAIPAIPAGAPPRRIGFCLGNRLEYVVLYFATLYAGDLPL